MPPLQRLMKRKPENLDYLGVSYVLTSQLLRYSTSFLMSQFGILNNKQVLEESGIRSFVHPTND